MNRLRFPAAPVLLVGLLLFLAGVSPAPLRAEAIGVDGPEALKVELRKVRGGEVLRLAPGDYGALRLILSEAPALRTRSPVTLVSDNPSDPARFSSLVANGVSNIVLDSLLFDYRFSPGDNHFTRKFSLGSVDGITIRNSVFDGDVASQTSAVDDGYPIATGLEVRNTRNVRLERNEFRNFYRGLLLSRTKGLVVVGNDIHASRSEGMNLAQVEDVLIEGNYIHDFVVSSDSGDHRDMIQFWSASTDAPSRRVTIRNNLLNSGNGLYSQSIFIRNERVDSGDAGRDMFYSDFLIEGNVIINAHLHGISVGETDGLTIRRNTLVHNRRSDGPGGSADLWTPRIRLSPRSDNVHVTDNITAAIDTTSRDAALRTDWQVAGNLLVQDLDPGKPGWYDDVFVAARTGDPESLASFFCLAGGACMTGGVGAEALRTGDAGFPGPVGPAWRAASRPAARAETVAIRVQPDPDHPNRFALQAVTTGLATSSGAAAFDWRIDGKAETGSSMSVVFTTPGRHEVNLTAHLPSGSEVSSSAWIEVADPNLLRFEGKGLAVPVRGAPPGPTHWQAVQVKDMPDSGPIRLGADHPAIMVHGSIMQSLFGARDFELGLKFRTLPGQLQPGGEILRVHQLMLLGLTPTGGLSFQLFPATGKTPVVVGTAPLRLHDGAWHDVVIRYSSRDGLVRIMVDGAEHGRARMAGPIAQNGNWGLSLGNPWGQKTMEGEIAALSLRRNAGAFLPPG